MDIWFELKIFLSKDFPPILKEVISSKLFELGAQGVVEDLGFVSGYFPEKDKARVTEQLPNSLEQLQSLMPSKALPRWEWCQVPEVNWVEKYKEHFKAQKLTNLFYLQPAWDKETAVPPEMIPIRMELGQAFGTGLHASTRLALKLTESIVGKFANPGELSLLDVGTGSGILAIGAEKLGVGKIHAFDIDEVSVEVAAVNVKENDCHRITLDTKPIEQIKERYNVVVANILLETHRLLDSHYYRVCKDNGYLILAGFLSYQLKDYRKSLPKEHWKVLQECHLQDWGALLLGRKF